MTTFPKFENWVPTRKTLHLYSHILDTVPRTHLEQHPKWWHISLNVKPNGMAGKEIDLPDGGKMYLFMNFKNHSIELYKDDVVFRSFDMTAELSGFKMGEEILSAVGELGLEGEYKRDRFENYDSREYDKVQAETFLQAVNEVAVVLEKHRGTLDNDPGPIQLWPHHFDMSFEWFGSKQVSYEKNGETTYFPSQLNCGFSLGDAAHPDPYFYSNPWPFAEEALTDKELPHGAFWHLEGWQGTLLDYNVIADDSEGSGKLLDYAQAVYKLAKPTLLE